MGVHDRGKAECEIFGGERRKLRFRSVSLSERRDDCHTVPFPRARGLGHGHRPCWRREGEGRG